LYENTDKIVEMLSLPPPLTHCCLERLITGFFGGERGQSNIVKGERGKVLLW